ncbi:MAG: 4Fe-4S binding protein [Coriobacteriia bacterium]|nr:4Fe-4S binding protein [Coriobacteriia bacterium]
MCQFCVQHGDGKAWYLQAENYAFDLSRDLERRGYVIDFVRNFDGNRARLLTGVEVLERAPDNVERAVKGRITKRMQGHHFGQPVPIEECERIFDFATSIVRLPCVCRTYAGKAERGYCLAVTAVPMDDTLADAFEGFDMGPDISRLESMSADEAMTLLRQCEREGLMHSVWTFITPFIGAICNCDLPSGCMAMQLTVAHDVKIMWRGEHVATMAEERCTSCGSCVEICPFGAIEVTDSEEAVALRQGDCWGCGVCRAACEQGAISLVPRLSIPAVADLW